jgi:hypothetical protein
MIEERRLVARERQRVETPLRWSSSARVGAPGPVSVSLVNSGAAAIRTDEEAFIEKLKEEGEKRLLEEEAHRKQEEEEQKRKTRKEMEAKYRQQKEVLDRQAEQARKCKREAENRLKQERLVGSSNWRRNPVTEVPPPSPLSQFDRARNRNPDRGRGSSSVGGNWKSKPPEPQPDDERRDMRRPVLLVSRKEECLNWRKNCLKSGQARRQDHVDFLKIIVSVPIAKSNCLQCSGSPNKEGLQI